MPAAAERLRARRHGARRGRATSSRNACSASSPKTWACCPARLFERLVAVADRRPRGCARSCSNLFEAMRDGGLFGVDDVPWFNGGLFAARRACPPLAAPDVAALRAASALNWSAIDATIFGTLFERGLDPAKRSQLGATSPTR